MAKKNITTDDLAVMVKKGFDETAKKRDLDLLRVDVHDIKERVENIEHLLLKQHSFKIQDLEKRMRRMEDLLAMK